MRADLHPVRELRDLPVVDRDGLRCGVVDEVLFEGGPGKPLRIAAIQVGPGAWTARLPGWAMALVGRLAGRRQATIAWSEVDRVTGHVALKGRAAELNLAGADRRLREPLSRIPLG